MTRKSHPKKEVEDALRYAESRGWRVEVGGSRALCRYGEFCITSIWSTPKNPANHGKQLRRVVDNCVGLSTDAEE